MTIVIKASAATVRAVSAAIGRAALFDDRITEGDPARVAAWAEAAEPHGLDVADLLAAVTRHYDRPNPDTIRVGDMLAHAREIRRDREAREPRHVREAREARLDDRLALPPAPADQGPPTELDPCSACGAAIGAACVNPRTGKPRRAPCVARLRRTIAAAARQSKRGYRRRPDADDPLHARIVSDMTVERGRITRDLVRNA